MFQPTKKPDPFAVDMPQLEPFNQQLNINPAPAPKPGMFGAGGVGRTIAGSIGDLLLQQSGMQPIFAPVMRQRQQQAAEAQQYEQRRADGMSDWVQKQTWELANRPAPQPTEFERIVAAGGYQPGTEEYTRLMRQYAEARANPMQAMDVAQPDGSVIRQFVRPNAMGGNSAPPSAPVGDLVPIGGQPATPAGPFRR